MTLIEKQQSVKVSIVILHYDHGDILTECLESCRGITFPNFEIILVLNGQKAIRNWQVVRNNEYPDVALVIENMENHGYARANNIGMQEALRRGAGYVLLLNDDTVVSRDFLDILLESFKNRDAVGVVGPRIYYHHAHDRICPTGVRFEPEQASFSFLPTPEREKENDSNIMESDFITGCAALVSRDVLEQVGMLDEDFFLYWEDADWGLRVKKAGLKNLIVTRAHVWHRLSVSMGGDDSAFKIYHKTRSHLLFASRHAPEALFRLHKKYLNDVLWLLFKSGKRTRYGKARAYLAALFDYHRRRRDEGPLWLR